MIHSAQLIFGLDIAMPDPNTRRMVDAVAIVDAAAVFGVFCGVSPEKRKTEHNGVFQPSLLEMARLSPSAPVVGRGHVSLLIILDTCYPKTVWGIGRLLI